MRNLLILTGIIMTCSLTSCGQDIDCKSLRKGSFELIGEDSTTHIITRLDNKQHETIKEFGLVSEFDLEWINECEYKLFNHKVVKGKDRFPEMKIDTLHCKIIDINGKEHTTQTIWKKVGYIAEATLKKV
jgi:hypothetical protein